MMKIYELTHEFYREDNEIICSRKSLGFFLSYNSAKAAVQYYSNVSGFRENPDAFSIRERFVGGEALENTVFEAIIYLHSVDYETEIVIEIGVFSNKNVAENKLNQYCRENDVLVNVKDLIAEKILNKCTIDKKEWTEGFSWENDSGSGTGDGLREP